MKVKTNDGNWIPAEPVPGTIVLFVGDLLELWTGKYYKAAVFVLHINAMIHFHVVYNFKVHRVQQPKDDKNQCRQSIAYFLNLDTEVIVKPFADGICCNNYENMGPIQFEPFSIRTFVEKKNAAAYGPK